MHTMTRRGFGALAGTAALTTMIPAAGRAQDIRRLEVIIPYSAGGGTDNQARAMVEALRPLLNAPIAVRNVPGDAALLGLAQLSRERPNSATLAFHNPPNTVLAQLARGAAAPVDLRTLTPIAGYGQTFSVLAVHAESPYQTWADLKAAYDAGTERLFSGTDRGGSAELAAHLIRDQWDLKWQEYVAYDGSGDLNAALARKEIPAGLGSFDAVLSATNSGVLRPLVVLGSEKRHDGMPDTPTSLELGMTSLAEVAAPIRVIVGPPDMEPGLRDRLVDLWRQTITDPEVIARMKAQKVDLIYMSPEEVKSQIDGAFAKLDGLPALQAILSGR